MLSRACRCNFEGLQRDHRLSAFNGEYTNHAEDEYDIEESYDSDDGSADAEEEEDSSHARVCGYYIRGHCKKGADCDLLHDDEARASRGKGRGTRMCNYFLKGKCKNGDHCSFRHARPEGELTGTAHLPRRICATCQTSFPTAFKGPDHLAKCSACRRK